MTAPVVLDLSRRCNSSGEVDGYVRGRISDPTGVVRVEAWIEVLGDLYYRQRGPFPSIDIDGRFEISGLWCPPFGTPWRLHLVLPAVDMFFTGPTVAPSYWPEALSAYPDRPTAAVGGPY
jgi:hypothetical protein